MNTNTLSTLLRAALLAACVAVPAFAADTVTPKATPAPKTARKASDPTVAAPKANNKRFFELHESFLKRAKEGPVGLLFLGDSITEGWRKAPEVWNRYYAKYNVANFGIGGDRTEHILWRIDNGELDGIKPKVVVLMIGTNNTGSNSADQIAAADRKIVQALRSKLPESKVLLLAVFPRGPRKGAGGKVDEGDARMKMAKIDAVNAALAQLDDGKSVRFLNINEKFLADGKIPADIMPDQLHPSAKGYQIWAEAMQPLLDEMMR
ncbi:MAG TPA: GDSL-type esterase/lipase family protein [Kiritimatiellia bacterium]|nr:GDSL-type esterase/lipase family protein [Kiritimatiellia bacterium]HPS09486.1 GDSL-type esterase/lipase family protein [Kiritimatiellia bacterium]